MSNIIAGPCLAGRQKVPLGGLSGQVVQADEYGNPSWQDVATVNNYGPVKTIALRAGGAHYAVDDVLTLVQDGASGATATVDTVDDDGTITGITLDAVGTRYKIASGLATTVAPTGGSGATVDVTDLTVTEFASAAEVNVGTEAAKIISPKTLRDGLNLATEITTDPSHLITLVSGIWKRLTWAGIKALLATAFKHGGTDEIATATPGANVIPKAGASGTLAAGFIPQATESAVGGGELATSVEVAAGSSSTTLITPSALAAGFPHIKRLAAAEAETAMFDYDTAAKMPPALLREIVEASSGGAATVLVDDLGYPSMMYIIRGPILAGHIHADMGSVSALKTAVIAAAGTGYTANDVLTIAGGTGGTVRVLTVGASGEVTSIVIANPGTGYSAATGAATTGGTGSACTITTTIAPVHPAFRVNGTDKNALYIGMFKSYQYGSGATARAVSWPGLMPTASLDFDASKALHTNKGAGFHMMTMWEQGLLMWMSMKMSTEPRGNTYYGRSHESGYEYECGIRSDSLNPGTTSGTGKHRNGSGPDSWSHNGKRWGVHDLVGSLWEWRDGMKIIDGRIYMPNDNYYTLAEASWPSQDVYFDNTTATSGGAPRLSNARDNALVDPNYSSVTHNAMTLTAGFDGLDLAIRQRMLLAGLAPKISSGVTNPWSPKGTLYHRNYGERLPGCGGSWSGGSSAGLAALSLFDPRSVVSYYIGSRLAFLSP